MMLSQLASVNSLHIIDHQLNKLSMWVDPHRKKNQHTQQITIRSTSLKR